MAAMTTTGAGEGSMASRAQGLGREGRATRPQSPTCHLPHRLLGPRPPQPVPVPLLFLSSSSLYRSPHVHVFKVHLRK